VKGIVGIITGEDGRLGSLPSRKTTQASTVGGRQDGLLLRKSSNVGISRSDNHAVDHKGLVQGEAGAGYESSNANISKIYNIRTSFLRVGRVCSSCLLVN